VQAGRRRVKEAKERAHAKVGTGVAPPQLLLWRPIQHAIGVNEQPLHHQHFLCYTDSASVCDKRQKPARAQFPFVFAAQKDEQRRAHDEFARRGKRQFGREIAVRVIWMVAVEMIDALLLLCAVLVQKDVQQDGKGEENLGGGRSLKPSVGIVAVGSRRQRGCQLLSLLLWRLMHLENGRKTISCSLLGGAGLIHSSREECAGRCSQRTEVQRMMPG